MSEPKVLFGIVINTKQNSKPKTIVKTLHKHSSISNQVAESIKLAVVFEYTRLKFSRVIMGKPGHHVKPGHLSMEASYIKQRNPTVTIYLFTDCVNMQVVIFRLGATLLADLVSYVVVKR